MTIKDNESTIIDILEHGASELNDGVNFAKAVEEIRDTILLNQSTDGNGVSGATKSTTGLKKAVNNSVLDASVEE